MRKLNAIFVLGALIMTVIGTVGVQHVAAQSKRLTCESLNGEYTYCRVDTNNKVTLERKLSVMQCTYGSSWGYDNRGIWVDRGCRAEFLYGGSGSGAAVAAGAVIGGLILAGALANRNRNNETSNYSREDAYNLGHRDGESDARNGRSNSPNPERYSFSDRYRGDYRNGYSAGYSSESQSRNQNGYNEGYRFGAQDARNNYSNDYRRYRNSYNWSSENEFRRGYDAGYNDNRNSWGSSGGGYSSVPSFYIGTFRGYTPGNQTWTDITIYSDGSIRIKGQNGDSGNGYFRNGAAAFPWGTFRLKQSGNGFIAVDPNSRSQSVFYGRIR